MKRPVTAQQAIDMLAVMNMTAPAKATIRSWAERGAVRKYGLNSQGHQKYEFADIFRRARELDATAVA